MALIVEKFPFVGTTGQCLILNQREKLVYPFNLGNYSEIRFGMFFSFTSGAPNNNVPILTNDTNSQSTAITQGFFGFSTLNTGAYLPGQSGGYDYIGLYGYEGSASIGLSVGSPTISFAGGATPGASENWKAGITDTTGGYFSLSGYSANGLTCSIKCPNVATGATSFAGMFGMQLVMSGTNGVAFRTFSNDTTYASDVSTTALRNAMTSLGSTRSVWATGYYTTGQIPGGNRMSTPNSLLIYTPMLNSRLRIHNLVVERYA